MRSAGLRTARRTSLTLAAGLVAATGVTSAYAYFGGSGTGAGLAQTGVPTALTLSPGTPATALYPGSSAPVSLVATNPNGGPVRLPALALDTGRGTAGFAVDAGHAGCTPASFSFAGSDNDGAGWTVPGGGSLTLSLPGAVTAGATTPSACQGATVTIYLVAP